MHRPRPIVAVLPALILALLASTAATASEPRYPGPTWACDVAAGAWMVGGEAP